MAAFKPTYLYIKTHNVTGLKYFGKTVKSDPTTYPGSGTHWKNHILKHGNNVTTEIYGYYTVEDECKRDALKFSEDNCIVESEDWANMIVEDGCNKFAIQPSIESKKKQTDNLLTKYGQDYFSKIASQPKPQKTKDKIRKAALEQKTGSKNKGKVREVVECPYCMKRGSMNTMSRWHFTNCKKFQ